MWVNAGKLSCRRRALMPGYLFFMTTPKGWGEVKNIHGVCDVIANSEMASQVKPDEMFSLVVGHATGQHNEFNLAGLDRETRHRRKGRRPRPSRRARTMP
jgi:transcription antitermination factor NusG